MRDGAQQWGVTTTAQVTPRDCVGAIRTRRCRRRGCWVASPQPCHQAWTGEKHRATGIDSHTARAVTRLVGSAGGVSTPARPHTHTPSLRHPTQARRGIQAPLSRGHAHHLITA